jgi:hypothetical protein
MGVEQPTPVPPATRAALVAVDPTERPKAKVGPRTTADSPKDAEGASSVPSVELADVDLSPRVADDQIAQPEVQELPDLWPADMETTDEPVEQDSTEPGPRRSRRSRSGSTRTRPAARGLTDQVMPGPVYVWVQAAPTDDLAILVRSWMDKYQERYAQPAGSVLCHEQDLATLQGAGLPLDVREGVGIQPMQFWIGPK